MKNYIKIAFLLMLCSSSISKAQNVNAAFSEVLIEVNNYSPEKQLSLIQSTLSDYAPNVTVNYACTRSGWLLFRIYAGPIQNVDQLADVLKQAGFLFTVKENAGLSELIEICQEPLQNL